MFSEPLGLHLIVFRRAAEGVVETVGDNAVIQDLVDAGDSVVLRMRQHYSDESRDSRAIWNTGKS